jgi:hypothetical protein
MAKSSESSLDISPGFGYEKRLFPSTPLCSVIVIAADSSRADFQAGPRAYGD